MAFSFSGIVVVTYNYPSKSAIRYVLIRIDAAVLDAITCAWISTQADRDDGKGEWVIAIDGKVLRGAWTDENDKVTLFSAMLHDEDVTVAQVTVPDGTNEITQAEAILRAAQIPAGKSALFTMDAAQAQQETAEAIGRKPGSATLQPSRETSRPCREQYSMRSSRCSARHRMTSWKSTAAGGLRNGPAGLSARTASISRTPARPPSSAARYSKYPVTGSARRTP